MKIEDGSFQLNQCLMCKFYKGGNTCPAFPEGIPKDITDMDFDHRFPYPPGDRGVHFEGFDDESTVRIAAYWRNEKADQVTSKIYAEILNNPDFSAADLDAFIALQNEA